jgi:hypothetical protein
MPATTHTEMSIERVAKLIEAYGSNTQCWPEQERAGAIAQLESSSQLQKLFDEAQELDAALLAGHVEEQPDDALLARIVDNLPAQPVTGQVVAKLGWMQYWPTALAAAITGMAIMLVVMNGPEQEMQYEQLVLQEIDYWLWQDVTDQVSFDSSEESPTDFMSML